MDDTRNAREAATEPTRRQEQATESQSEPPKTAWDAFIDRLDTVLNRIEDE